METNEVKVKVLRSLGTAQGTLTPGATLVLEERTASNWEESGYVEIIERPEPPKQPEGDDQEDEDADKQPEGPADNKESNEALEAAVETPEAKKPAARNSKAKK